MIKKIGCICHDFELKLKKKSYMLKSFNQSNVCELNAAPTTRLRARPKENKRFNYDLLRAST